MGPDWRPAAPLPSRTSVLGREGPPRKKAQALTLGAFVFCPLKAWSFEKHLYQGPGLPIIGIYRCLYGKDIQGPVPLLKTWWLVFPKVGCSGQHQAVESRVWPGR